MSSRQRKKTSVADAEKDDVCLKHDILNWMMEEYKLSSGASHRYINYIYNIINYSIVILAGLLTVGEAIREESYSLIIYLIIIPISFVAFGLFYCYNSYTISRSDLFELELEQKINDYFSNNFIKNRNVWLGRRHYVLSDKRKGFVIPYGTMLVVYILIPLASIAYAFLKYDIANKYNFGYMLLGFFAIAYLIYICLIGYLVRNNIIALRQVKELRKKRSDMNLVK